MNIGQLLGQVGDTAAAIYLPGQPETGEPVAIDLSVYGQPPDIEVYPSATTAGSAAYAGAAAQESPDYGVKVWTVNGTEIVHSYAPRNLMFCLVVDYIYNPSGTYTFSTDYDGHLVVQVVPLGTRNFVYHTSSQRDGLIYQRTGQTFTWKRHTGTAPGGWSYLADTACFFGMVHRS